LGGVPTSILYDNTKLAVARILGDGTRQKTRAFSELQSHYLFAEKFGRPAKGNDKGKVEGLVGYARQKRDYASAIKRYFVTRTFNYSHLNLALNQHLGVRIPRGQPIPSCGVLREESR
jgi:transposase